MRPTRFLLHIVLVLASVSALACGQENPKPEEQAPSATAQPVSVPAADPSTEPAPAEPAQPEPVPAPVPVPVPVPKKPEAVAEGPATAKVATTEICTQVCDRTEKLNCGPLEACMAACAAANDGSVCPAEMSKFMACALKHPAEHWECSDEGVAAIRDGYCDKEQEAFMGCAMKTN